jgi:hypothetical protein
MRSASGLASKRRETESLATQHHYRLEFRSPPHRHDARQEHSHREQSPNPMNVVMLKAPAPKVRSGMAGSGIGIVSTTEKQNAPTSPIPVPHATGRRPCLNTMRITSNGSAPSAIRTPISWTLCETCKARYRRFLRPTGAAPTGRVSRKRPRAPSPLTFESRGGHPPESRQADVRR